MKSLSSAPSPASRAARRRGAVLFVLFLLAACGGPPEAPPAAPDVYRVRGMVRQLPAGPAGDLLVRHEAVPGFKDADGEVVGMESMTMPFPLADASLAAGLAAGDRIEMEFEVRWDGGNPLRITVLEKLPPDTRLEFEKSEGDGEGTPSP